MGVKAQMDSHDLALFKENKILHPEGKQIHYVKDNYQQGTTDNH
jgi:hypothetical protein